MLGILEERPNLTPEVTLLYRPLGVPEREKTYRMLGELKPFSDEKRKARCKVLSDRIERWSFTRPVTAENIGLLKPMLFDLFEALIYGSTGPDKILSSKEEWGIKEVEKDLKN